MSGVPELPAQPVSFTFGHYTQTGPWSDVRSMSWDEATKLLTHHEVGPKEGTCIVPATFRGTRRHKNDAQRIDVVFLDSDAGHTLAEITDALRERGWTAVVSSTHSHLTTRTRARRGNWDQYRLTAEDPALAPASFLAAKGYLPRVVEGTQIVEETEELVVFEHQPCPKFRIAILLQRPWLSNNYDNQHAANAAWKERIEALAATLRLNHDQACTDTSRLFFLPRCPADGPDAEVAMLDGTPCDIFALPAVEKPKRATARPKRSAESRKQQPAAVVEKQDEFTDPSTGKVFDLSAWVRATGRRFELVEALRTRRPEVFVGRVAEGTKHHIRCANEDRHTQAGRDAATMIINASQSAVRGFVYHCRHAHCVGHGRTFFLRRMLEQGWLTTDDLRDPRFLADENTLHPLIQFVPGKIPEVVDQAEHALLRADLGIYQRGAFIVRPGVVPVNVTRDQEVTAQRIFELGEHALVEALTVAADWERYDGRSEQWVPSDAPMKVAATYRQRVGHWCLPVLMGIINAPTLRPDGSILVEAGYDSATGLLLDTCGVTFPAVPQRPTHAEAVSAIAILTDLINTFPFLDPASQTVALSNILTACIRPSLSTAPMHAFTAPAAGSGKSMLVDVASCIAAGREAGVIAQGRTEEELEKRLGALLLDGEQVIAINNCETPLGGEFLCSMLTQRRVRPRILGRSEAPELPANAMVTATGNNLVLVGDMTRRAVLCRLDPQHERPELRRFSSNPVATVKADRGRYLMAALTVLRAYHVAGRPDCPEPLGSFEEWSNWVRGALLWVGQADPVETMADARDQDPKLDALTAVLVQWRAVIGSAGVTVRELIDCATQQYIAGEQGFLGYTKQPFKHPDFREALLAVAGEGGVVNSKRLGKWLAANQDRIVQGVRIVRQGLNAGLLRWELQTAGSEAGF